MYFTVFKILGTAAESNDVMQDVYVSFLNRLDDIDENGNAYAYLVASAKNKALNALRQKKRLLALDETRDFADLKQEIPDDMPLLKHAKKFFPKKSGSCWNYAWFSGIKEWKPQNCSARPFPR